MSSRKTPHPNYLVSAARNGNVDLVSKILKELSNSEWGSSEQRPRLTSRVWTSLVVLAGGGGRRTTTTTTSTSTTTATAARTAENLRNRTNPNPTVTSSRERSASSSTSSIIQSRRVTSTTRSGSRRSDTSHLLLDTSDPTSPSTSNHDPTAESRRRRVAKLTHFTSGNVFEEFHEEENPENPDPIGIVDLDDVKPTTSSDMNVNTSGLVSSSSNLLTLQNTLTTTTSSVNSRSTISYDGGGGGSLAYTPPSSIGSNEGSMQSAPDLLRDHHSLGKQSQGGDGGLYDKNSHSLTNPDRFSLKKQNMGKSIIFTETISLSRAIATLERDAFRSLSLMPPSSLPNPIHNVDRHLLSPIVADALDQDIGTWTALHFACDRQDEKGARIVEMMLSAGADPCIENSAGDTPLHLAVDAGNDSSVLALLQCGAKADAFDTRGVGPLHIACKRSNSRVTHWLLAFGKASPNKLTERSKSALHYAINGALSASQNVGGVLACVDLLLTAGANPNVASRPSLETPLHIAARCGHAKVVSSLMRRGANVRLKNCDGEEPPKIAIRYGHTAIAKQITGHWRIAFFLLMELCARDLVTLRSTTELTSSSSSKASESVLLTVGKRLPKSVRAKIVTFL
jgi:ankyrin repeat protein